MDGKREEEEIKQGGGGGHLRQASNSEDAAGGMPQTRSDDRLDLDVLDRVLRSNSNVTWHAGADTCRKPLPEEWGVGFGVDTATAGGGQHAAASDSGGRAACQRTPCCQFGAALSKARFSQDKVVVMPVVGVVLNYLDRASTGTSGI